MNKSFGIALFVIGMILFVFGIKAMGSFGSQVKEAFTGTPTDKSIFFLIGGAVTAAIGSYLTLGRRGV